MNLVQTENKIHLKIVDTLEPYYEADLLEDSFNDIPIAKVSLDREKRLKVDCVNEHVKENHKDFGFKIQ